MSVAGGILSTFEVDTGNAMIDGIQVMGGMEAALIIQTVSLNQLPVINNS
jgi:hypothetical protein